MSFRTRLFVTLSIAALLPLAALALGVRREMERRLSAEYQRRVSSALESVREDLERESAGIASRLGALAGDLEVDNQFRLAAVALDQAQRGYLLDYGAKAMRLSGLSFLQVQDTAGRILTSGHFRNEYDRLDPAPTRTLAASPGAALVKVRAPEQPFIALARLDSFDLGGQRFTLMGGTAIDPRTLGGPARGREMSVSLELPGDSVASGADQEEVVARLPLPYLDLTAESSGGFEIARLAVTQSAGTLRGLRRSIDLWFLGVLGVTALLALLAAAALSARISRPLMELAEKTSAIDLDRLDQDFTSGRNDEIGALSRLLGAMTQRLRLSANRLREAERRIATGDLARQVNHDVKNGLVPIRNVLRHFAEVAVADPQRLAEVFEERKGTLDSSITYLDSLASNYARLSPAPAKVSCDLNAVAREVVRSVLPGTAAIGAELADTLPVIHGDPIVLRRILENLVSNAVHSLAGRANGRVTVSTGVTDGNGAPLVRLAVADTGPGMTREQLERAFDDFHTTKPGGTGLGLSIVRRLVTDRGGSLRVETEPGAGTRVTVELPAPPSDGQGAGA
jgi:signal transduction histidine kinase